MASMYYVKVYYTKQQQQPEIRRFAIDISPENNIYQELGTKIATYQPDIQLNGFTLQYIDEENERITFSSNEELRSAIASNTDGTALKVFVTPNQQQQQQQQQQSTTNKECHTGVECDGCKGLVIGFRYKCVICPNYDLCENCSAAGVHSEHNMIKITKPGNYYHPYGPRHHGNGNGRRHHHRHTPPFIPSPEFFENIQAQIPQWLPNRENTAHLRQHMQQHFDSFRNNTQTHMQNSKQYLESVGQYLQQALSPFGIDCDYRVDDSTKNNNNQQQQQQQQTASSSTTTTTATDENPTPTEPSAVPKDTDATSDTTNSNRGISSWLNMFRAGEGTASTITTDDTTEKAVEDCVEKMKAMGFDNPNNELMDLIRSKNGDLNSVLDEMTRYHQP